MMHLVFVLPDILGSPTGGNRYNAEIMQRLRHTDTIAEVVVPESGGITGFPEGVLVLDSLLSPLAPTMRQHYPGRPIVLLLHYLALCDPQAMAPAEPLSDYDGIITTSQFSASCVIAAGFDAARVHCVYPGLDAEFATPLSADRLPTILTVANHLPGKRLLEMVDILEQALQPAWRWTIVGDGALDPVYSARLHDRVRHSSIQNRIDLVGPFDKPALKEAYQEASIFLLPSRFETLSMATREAMASGLPAVAFDVGGLYESVDEGCGYLVSFGDDEAMAARLIHLQTNAETRNAMGLAAHAKAKSFSTWEDAATQFRAALSAVC